MITTVPQSSGDGYEQRKKKYAIMMATRAVCVILAASTYSVSLYLSLTFAFAGVVVPWCAVLIANDRPAKRRRARMGHVSVPAERALPPGSDERVVDG